MGQHAAYDTRKRGFEAINDFFGDVKRRQIDPNSYPQVGQRLMALHGIPIQGTLMDYAPAPSMVAVGGHGHASASSVPQPHYALPMPNLRTKSDLLNIDNFLDQMQSTVYESSNAAAAAGVHQPGAHYTHQSLNFRQSHSPPHTAMHHQLGPAGSHSVATVSAPMMPGGSSHSPQNGTPALTPPSSTQSYTSSHSPTSVPGLSPSSRHNSTTLATYPTLPAVSSGYPNQASGAPVSTLGPIFDNDPRRRYHGGMLQRSAGPREADESGSSATSMPSSKESTPRASSSDHLNSGTTSSVIDPALAGVTSPTPSEGPEAAHDRDEEIWVENIRVIEALKHFIRDQLDRHMYEEDDDVEMMEGESIKQEVTSPSSNNTAEGDSLYPVLRAAIDSAM